jgi:hypothetical protein
MSIEIFRWPAIQDAVADGYPVQLVVNPAKTDSWSPLFGDVGLAGLATGIMGLRMVSGALVQRTTKQYRSCGDNAGLY